MDHLFFKELNSIYHILEYFLNTVWNTLVDSSKGCLKTKLRVFQSFLVRTITLTSLRQILVNIDAELRRIILFSKFVRKRSMKILGVNS